MYEVLVPIDESMARATAQAESLCDLRTEGTSLSTYLLHVFDENTTGASVRQVEAVRHVDSLLQELGVETMLVEASGDPIERILQQIDEQGVDLVCMSGRKRTPAGKVLFGSVTQSVALESNLPILICGTKEEELVE